MMEPGTVFEPWVCVKRLGTGGYGIVCQWTNKRNRQKIAIKMCRELDNGDPRQKERWINEIDFMKQIEHPNIVKGLNVEPQNFMEFLCQMSPLPPLAMEYCEKGDLRKVLNKPKNLNGLPEAEVRNILRALRNAIEYMHSKEITHRDIKPENLVIKEEHGLDVYKLTDLGYARLIGSSTIEASHVGTFEYFAPEVITEQSYSNTVDYWSMGVIAFEIICGCRPFLPGCSPLECIPKIKEKQNKHIAITMNYSSGDQFQSHTALFVQNQLSSSLKERLEQWLTIPLAVNPHDRATVSNNNRAPDAVRTCNNSPPKRKFYTVLDEILATKILTIFCLYNNRVFSYVITEDTTRDQLDRQLSLDTQIPKDRLYLILPPDNLSLSRITETTEPIQMYINGLHNKPMLYCTYLDETRNDDRPISCSHVISNMLSKLNVKSRRHALEFGKHLLFVVRKECQLCTTFINGLTNYSMLNNEFLLKFQNQVVEMQQKFWQLQGTVRFFVSQVQYLERMLIERNGFSDVTVMQAKLQKDHGIVNDRFEKFEKLFHHSKQRYTSALRRSHEVLDALKSYPKRIEDEAQAQLSKGENLYGELRSTENMKEKVKELIDFFYGFQNCIIFLRSSEIKDIQKRNFEIHNEFELIEKIIAGLIIELQRFLEEFNSNYSSCLCNIASTVASNDRPNIPNLDSIFESMNLNGEEMDHSHSNGYSMDGNCGDMASIVFENQQLIDEAQTLFRDKMQQD